MESFFGISSTLSENVNTRRIISLLRVTNSILFIKNNILLAIKFSIYILISLSLHIQTVGVIRIGVLKEESSVDTQLSCI